MTADSRFGEAGEMEAEVMAASGGDDKNDKDADETATGQVEKEDPRLEAARQYVKDWRSAKSQEERDGLIQKVLADPQMKALFDENSELMNELGMGDLLSGSKSEGANASAEAEAKTAELDPALKQAASETLEHLQALLRTSNAVATGGYNEIAALIKARGDADDELEPFTRRITALQQAIQTNDTDVIRQTHDWLKNSIPFLQNRIRATVNYLGGAPDELIGQANIVKQVEQDAQNLEHYLPKTSETPKAA